MTELYIIEASDHTRAWTGCASHMRDIAPTIAQASGPVKATVSHWQRDPQAAYATHRHALVHDHDWRGGPLGGWRLVERFQWPR